MIRQRAHRSLEANTQQKTKDIYFIVTFIVAGSSFYTMDDTLKLRKGDLC